MSDPISGSLVQPSDLGTNPEAIARRWKLEIKLADKRERKWRETVKKIYELYTPNEPASNSFNILWSNTETLRYAVYNSLPEPQCRRRYSDEDPLGRQTSKVLTRALEFAQDSYDFDGAMQGDVLAFLLAGRAVSRVRYVPNIRQVDGIDEENDRNEQNSTGSDDYSVETAGTEAYEEIEWEQVICERVAYDDFRILSAAKRWEDVCAIAFRHRLTRDDLIEKFGEEIGNKIVLDSVADSDVKESKELDLFKTAEIWEIWDKDDKKVIWLAAGYPTPVKVQDDPLELFGFFPVPRPIYAIENDNSLIPAPLYTQYEQQARELNRVSVRINKLIDSLRSRGVYDATLSELSELMKSGDNDLIPSQNVTALIERGGLEKAIWMMPIQQTAIVLKELYAQRDATKAVIYELTGISDIMRAASDPRETFGAQKIKSEWGTQRLQRMQREVQRYIRDIIRLKAEIISEKFQGATLEAMTLVQLPHRQELEQQKQMAIMQYQQQAQQAMMTGQQPPPPPQAPPPQVTWEDVLDELHNDANRTYRIDIETDSTLGATQDSDMTSLRELLTGMSQLIAGFGPAVQAGAIPIEAVKAIMGVVVRRAKMGSEVEDALDKMKMPQQQADPKIAAEAAKAQAEQQKQQMSMQHEQQLAVLKSQVDQAKEKAQADGDAAREQYRAQADMQIEQNRMVMDNQMNQQKLQAQFALDEAERNHKLQVEQMKLQNGGMTAQMEAELQKWKAELEASTKIMVAQIAAQAGLDQAAISAQVAADNTLESDLNN